MRLEAIGIATPLQLRQTDAAFVRQHCSMVMERMQALDAINARDGRGAIAYAASGTHHPFKIA